MVSLTRGPLGPATAVRAIKSLLHPVMSASSSRGYADAASVVPPPSVTQTPDKSHHILAYDDDAFPLGFSAAAVHAGIKKNKGGALDLGILVNTSDRPCAAAACFTRNVFKAAPVVVSTEILAKDQGRVTGLIVNSGCANAVTGQQGMKDAWAMSEQTTTAVASSSSSSSSSSSLPGTLVLSTGVIGQHLPIDSITSAIPSLVSSLAGTASSWMALAKSFMTTDTFPKLRAKTFTLGDKTYRLAGIDKGAGMIHPNMGPPAGPPHATLLGVIVTDAPIAPCALQSALTYAVDRSFNAISVDGDMSTNDTILCLANGAADADKGAEITEATHPAEYATFRQELQAFAQELAQLVVRDGEGATKFVTIRVENAPSYEVARKVASSVATSSLFKTAMYGQDANWGRILCAVGYTDVPEDTISPTSVSVAFIPPSNSENTKSLQLLTNGEPEPNIDEERASEILKEEDLEVLVDLGVKGGQGAKYWTCDFSHEYVTINGSVSGNLYFFRQSPLVFTDPSICCCSHRPVSAFM